MGSKRTIGFCIKNNLLRAGDKIKFESGWESIVDSISPTEITTRNGKVFDLTAKIYPPKKAEIVEHKPKTCKVTVTVKCVTYHEITVSADDLDSGLMDVKAMTPWNVLLDSEITDFDEDTFTIEAAVKN